jgi:hypothetical protein
MIAKKCKILFLCVLILFAYVATEAFCGTINTKITSRSTILPDGGVHVKYEIGNTGDDTAYHVSVATFLALDAHQSDDLGNNPPGGVIGYDCILRPSSMKPGKYTLVTRISFAEQNSITHSIYQFAAIAYHPEQATDTKDVLSISLSDPTFNLKGFRKSGGTCRLSLKNNLGVAIRPVVALYLPDGFTTKEPEHAYELAPGENKEIVIPIEMATPIKGVRPYYAVVWYEQKGIHFSQLVEGSVTVEEKPFYFKVFLIFVGIALIISMAGFYLRRRV